MASPVSRRTRSMNSLLLAAIRHASVAISRERDTPRRRILSGTDLERVDGAAHGGIGKMAGAQHAFAETNDAGESVDDEKAAARRSCHQAAGNCWCRGRAPHKPELRRASHARPHRSCPGLPPIGPQPALHTAHGPRLMLGRRPPRSRWSRSAWTLRPAEAWQPRGHCRSAQSRCLTLMSAALAYLLGSERARPRQWFDKFTVARS